MSVDHSGIDDFEARVEKALAEAIFDVADVGLEESLRIVPIEEATLAGSGTVTMQRGGAKVTTHADANEDGTGGTAQTTTSGRPTPTSSPLAAISFDTPYAVVQHEDTSLRHDAGRTAGYLQRPMNERRADFERHIARKLSEVAR